METLVFVEQHRNQYYSGRGKGNSPMRFGSSPSGGFRDFNCRAFEYGVGLLPSPFKGYGSPVSNCGFLSPKPQSQCGGKLNAGGGKSKSEEVKKSKKFVKSSPIAINLKGGGNGKTERMLRENRSLSELWAGPAYSNSPPPSSLPIPKFSVKPKRTVSLELPAFESDLELQPMAKSAPASPTRDGVRSPVSFFGDDGSSSGSSGDDGSSSGLSGDDESATRTLRRILNLDIVDD